jgi:hypothetical protein
VVAGPSSDHELAGRFALRGKPDRYSSHVRHAQHRNHFGDPAKVYLAPEALSGGEAGAQADVFSLGAIAYHLFTGRPPADSPLDLPAKLREGGGLRLAEAVDGIGSFLQDMVRAPSAQHAVDKV